MKKLEVLLATGMPGLYRVITFFFIAHLVSLEELGRTATVFFIAQIVAFFTAIGWASLIMVRVSSARTEQAQRSAFYALVGMGFKTTGMVMIGILLILSMLPMLTLKREVIEVNATAFVFALLSWTMYQLGRHYFVAKKDYRRTLMFDLLLIVLSLGFVGIAHTRFDAATALSAGLLMTAMLMFGRIGLPTSWRCLWAARYDIKGLELGLTNFLTGGIALSLVPLASFLEGETFAGAVSLITSLIAIGLLVPRALSLYQLPDLARQVSRQESIVSTVKEMKKHIFLSNAATGVLNIVLVGVVAIGIVDPQLKMAVWMSGVLLSIQNFTAMAGLVCSNVLVVHEKSRLSATLNVGMASLFATCVGGALLFDTRGTFFFILSALCAVTLLRNVFLWRYSHRLMQVGV